MALSIEDVTTLATALPDVTAADHHGMLSFRVRGKIIATVPDQSHLRVMLDEAGIRTAVAETPAACAEYYWGKRLACVVVTRRRSRSTRPGPPHRRLATPDRLTVWT